MLKGFNDLLKLDISDKISRKPTFRYDKTQNKTVPTGNYLDYISWVNALILLYENGAESVEYGNIYNKDGHSLFLCDGKVPEVHVFVSIDGKRYEMTYPVIDGSSDIKMEKIVQSDVHNASQRAFVKCVAVNTGLGLSLWVKEETDKPLKIDESVHNIMICLARVQRKYGEAVSKLGTERDLNNALQVNPKQLKLIFSSANSLRVLEEKLNKI